MDQIYRLIDPRNELHISQQLVSLVENKLNELGILSRVFGRVKSVDSVKAKVASRKEQGKPYGPNGPKMQDFYGLRVVVYFTDDVDVARRVVGNLFAYDSESVSDLSRDKFGPVRCNVVYRLPEDLHAQSLALQRLPLLDQTLEVQFRTVLSEGWHEVEHDLRYKRQHAWEQHEDLGRVINAILATLEGSDWTLLKAFDDLAHRHYKSQDYLEMVHAKFRLRFRTTGQLEAVWQLLAQDPALAKELFRVERAAYLGKLLELRGSVPTTPENVVLLANRFFMRDLQLQALEPPQIKAVMDRWEAQQPNGRAAVPHLAKQALEHAAPDGGSAMPLLRTSLS